ncbi:MAG TPA: hypothetical protein VNG35_05605 [Gemmatimonadales bacterium]|nr:hypothetical protein [Gemmatimonadales bacterium]
MDRRHQLRRRTSVDRSDKMLSCGANRSLEPVPGDDKKPVETRRERVRTVNTPDSHHMRMDDEAVFFTVFGAALAGAVLFGAAWWRARTRLNQLEDRLASSLGSRDSSDSSDVHDRISELAQRVAQLGRGQEFVQQLLSGKRRLPGSTPS